MGTGTQTATGDLPPDLQPVETVGPPPVLFEHCDTSSSAPSSGNTPHEDCTEAWTSNENRSRTADAEVKFYVGGKSTPGHQYLLSAYAEAGRPVDGADPGGPIPGGVLRAGDFGQLGADGRGYTTAASDSTKSITVRAPGYRYYTFTISPQKHKLRIVANGCPLANDRVVPSARFCVGQKICLSSYMTPSLDDQIQHLDAQWFTPNLFVNYIESWPAGAKKYLIDWTLTYQKDTYAWWVSGGEKHPRCDWTMTFNNGQTAKIAANGRMSIHRPTIAQWSPRLLGTPQVTLYSGSLSLGGGNAYPMSFKHYIRSEFSGQAGYTQLISGEFDSNVSVTTDSKLDNLEWARGLATIHATGSWSQNGVPFDDSPKVSLATIPLLNTTAMDLSFSTYLRFKPDSGNPEENIFVTLRLVSWGVTASATKSNGQWGVNQGSSASGPDDADSSDFPMWTDIFYNSGL